MNRISVGLVGFGLSGRYLQAPFYEALPQFKLAKIVTSRPIPKEIFREAKPASSVDDLLEDDDIELIAICTPNSTHYELTKKCLQAGKHVLVEKPATATLEETKELYNIAREQKKILCVYQNRRFDSDFLTCLKLIKGNFLGDIHTYEAHFHRYKPELNAKGWKEEVSPANGILYDLGAHLVDQAIFAFGKPLSFSGEAYTQRAGSTIDDAFFIQLNYEKLRVRLKSSLLVVDQGPKYEIHGMAGSFHKTGIDMQEDHLKLGMTPGQSEYGIEATANFGDLTTTLNGVNLKAKVTTETGNWQLLYLNLADSIRNGTPLIIKEEEILAQMEILENIKNNT
jgi:scyllo-inositol 2-dehydrogenase (NADP+)